MWTKQEDGETRQKRVLVSKKRLNASFNMGGLQIQDPEQKSAAMKMNLIQKLYKKLTSEPENNLLLLLGCTLRHNGLPTLKDLVENLAFSQSFSAIASFYHMQAKHKEAWPFVTIIGHPKEENFTPLDQIELKANNLKTVSQLFEERGGLLIPNFNPRILDMNLSPRLQAKLKKLHQKLKNSFNNFNEHSHSPITLTQFFLQKQRNISQIFMKLMRISADTAIGAPPPLPGLQE